MEINKNSAIWHAFGYHNAYNPNNRGFERTIISANTVKGLGYIPFIGTAIAIPTIFVCALKIKNYNKPSSTYKFYKGIIIRQILQSIPGSFVVLVPADLIFSIFRGLGKVCK